MQTQTENAPRIAERVFDETGQTVEEVAAAPVAEAPATPEIDPVDPAAAPAAAAAPKFRIGDREFATSEEAIAFAQSEISTRDLEVQVADAYRQGIRDAVAAPGAAAPGVTQPVAPAVPELNHEELYTKPAEYLAKRDAMIEERVLKTVTTAQGVQAQSNQIWSEFTHRHPELADFRTEVEGFVNGNLIAVQSVVATKGQASAYDFIATKLKSRFSAYAEATKPKRELPNTTAGASPGTRATGVTPPAPPKKELSFSEQISNIRRKKRS